MPDEVVYSETLPDTGFEFPGDPSANQEQVPKPIVIDPNQTYQFGNITQSGQDLVQSLIAPKNSEIESLNSEIQSLKSTMQELAQQIQQLTPHPQPKPQQPETRIAQWVSQRFGENPSQLDSITPQDLIQGLMALSQDTQTLVQGLMQAVPQRVEGILDSHTQRYQAVQSKEQALRQAIDLFLQNKAQARGLSVDQIRPNYAYAIRSIENSGTYLVSNNPAQISQFALDELAAYDRQISAAAESAEVAATEAARARSRQILDAAKQEMQMLRENPRRPLATNTAGTATNTHPQPVNQFPTVGGLIDAEQVFQQERRKPVVQRRY